MTLPVISGGGVYCSVDCSEICLGINTPFRFNRNQDIFPPTNTDSNTERWREKESEAVFCSRCTVKPFVRDGKRRVGVRKPGRRRGRFREKV